MAISQTMSNPIDNWMQFYQTNFSGQNQTEIPPTTTITTAIAATTPSRINNLSPDQGRVSKPIRRRSRASRRTPTTLLNTDTTNFRAMVQQFTGGPAATFAARPQPPSGGATFDFTQQIMGGNAGVAPANGFHVQYQSQVAQQQNMYMMNNMHGGGGRGGGAVSSHAPPGSSGSTSGTRNYENYLL